MTASDILLRRVDDQTVAGAGFHVTVHGAQEARYTEAERIARVEIAAGQVQPESLTDWEPPDGGPVMTAEQRQQILGRVAAALQLLGAPR